jgi:hypothetical protein
LVVVFVVVVAAVVCSSSFPRGIGILPRARLLFLLAICE